MTSCGLMPLGQKTHLLKWREVIRHVGCAPSDLGETQRAIERSFLQVLRCLYEAAPDIARWEDKPTRRLAKQAR